MVASTRSEPHEQRSTSRTPERAEREAAEQPSPPPAPVEEPTEAPQTEAEESELPLQPGPTPQDLAEALAKYLDEHSGPQFDAELDELRSRGSRIFARLRERYGSQQLHVAALELKRSRGYSY